MLPYRFNLGLAGPKTETGSQKVMVKENVLNLWQPGNREKEMSLAQN